VVEHVSRYNIGVSVPRSQQRRDGLRSLEVLCAVWELGELLHRLGGCALQHVADAWRDRHERVSFARADSFDGAADGAGARRGAHPADGSA
jgi:hypothetical protein